ARTTSGTAPLTNTTPSSTVNAASATAAAPASAGTPSGLTTPEPTCVFTPGRSEPSTAVTPAAATTAITAVRHRRDRGRPSGNSGGISANAVLAGIHNQVCGHARTAPSAVPGRDNA